MLYPKENIARQKMILDGLWRFSEDRDNVGVDEKWYNGLPNSRDMAVPGSWNEQYPDLYEYMGVGWYEKDVYIQSPKVDERVYIRVGSGSNKCTVYINANYAAFHEGGHLPFEADITDLITPDAVNKICITADQTLDPWSLPPASLQNNEGRAGFTTSYPSVPYDFYPYGGLERSVMILKVPTIRIDDITIKTKINGMVSYRIELSDVINGELQVSVGDYCNTHLLSGETVVNGTFEIENPILWCCENPYLYEMNVVLNSNNKIVDCYEQTFGIREIEVSGNNILLNGEKIFLRGFGKHEDFFCSGKGHNRAVNVKDFALLKWIGANSFRTSHYPYDEEILDMADRNGILVIDETPFVSLSNRMYTEEILQKAKKVIKELYDRDKNHPSVIIWSVANEPYVDTDESEDFFKAMAETVRSLDDTRLVTYVGFMGPEYNRGFHHFDIVCINKYHGWYFGCGRIDDTLESFGQCLDDFYNTFKKPLILSEFGADTIPGMHSTPAQMFTEEYQVEMLKKQISVLETKDYCLGYHVWAFADFKTAQTISRVFGNHKGVFTRDREPKMAAHFLKKHWTGKKNI